MGADVSTYRPATDLLIGHLAETLVEMQAHQHPERGSDLFCLNLTSYMGERMGPVLRRLADEQAETRKWREKHTALADEFTAEADRLNAQLAEVMAKRDAYEVEMESLRAELAQARRDLTEADQNYAGLQQHIADIRAGEF